MANVTTSGGGDGSGGSGTGGANIIIGELGRRETF